MSGRIKKLEFKQCMIANEVKILSVMIFPTMMDTFLVDMYI